MPCKKTSKKHKKTFIVLKHFVPLDRITSITLNIKTMENLKSYEKLAVEAIKKGGKFNGKFYGKYIYVSNEKYQIDNKDAFLSALNFQNAGFQVRSSKDIVNINRHGFDAIEM